ncbi:unnamed protein product [Arabidopsis lyrata]|nr:unnamed protein product [Arabidopsis lyrata]
MAVKVVLGSRALGHVVFPVVLSMKATADSGEEAVKSVLLGNGRSRRLLKSSMVLRIVIRLEMGLNFEERVVQVRRVTKVVKGGKQLKFRAIVVVGDKQGNVRVGCAKAKEVVAAVQKSAIDARRNIVQVPMTKYSTFPHRSEGDYGAAKVMLRPASPGTGLIAGGAVRIVLEMAGVENALGKQLGSNNARATLAAVQQMRQFRDVAQERGIPMEELCK